MESRFQRCYKSFTLTLFEEDFINIGKLVSKFPNQETGGNLFGLWTNQGNAVVLVATGPGENCTRSPASFFQDINYMARIGNLLTSTYPLCHIGEWHSHHRLSLLKPSEGDCNTIRRNYPRGSQGFILIIANIIQGGQVKLSPYKFTDEVSAYQVGEVESLPIKNPFNDVGIIRSAINKGKELIPKQPREISYLEEHDRTIRSRQRRNDFDTKSRLRSRSRSPQKIPQRYHPERTTQRDHQRSTSQSHIPQPPLYPRDPTNIIISRASGIQGKTYPRTRRNEDHRATESSTVPFNRTTVHALTALTEANNHLTSIQKPWYDRQEMLRETLSFIKDRADDREVTIKRDKNTMEVSFEFKHNHYKWIASFPNGFPHSGIVTLKKDTSTHPCVTRICLRGGFNDFQNDFRLKCSCSACL